MSKEKARSRARKNAVHLAALLLGSVAAPAVARAAEPPVAIGEVATRVSRTGLDLPRAVRGALERELLTAALDTKGKRYVLSASLVRLGAGTEERAHRAECAVSVVLREKKSGAIRAILEGKSRVEGDGGGMEISLVDAAVHAALSALPDAVR